MAKAARYLKRRDKEVDVNPILVEVNLDFGRTMN
jgi:hypothetical protein